MAKARIKPEELLRGAQPQIALLPDQQPASPFLDPSVAQAEPQGSELYNLGTVQQAAASQRDADMFNPSYLQPRQNYPTGTEGGTPRPEGANPLLYPTAQETQPKLKARLKPNEALALAEVNRPQRKSVDQVRDELATGMYDVSQTPLPQDLWKEATQRRSQMVKEGRLPMEMGEIDSLMGGLVWGKDALYGVGSYLIGTAADAAKSAATDPIGTTRQFPATMGASVQRLATELGLQTYQDLFNLTHEPKYRVKETGEFVAVNKTGLPFVMPAASGGNKVISGDGIIDPRTPERGIRAFAEQGKTLVPVGEQDLEDYRYGQYLDRMAVGAQSLEAQNFRVPSNLAQAALAASLFTPALLALMATDPGGSVGPNQAQTEVAVFAAQGAIPAGAASRSWGISRRVAGGLSKVAGASEAATGFLPDVEAALRARFVKKITDNTNLEAGAQKTAMQAAIDGGKTLGIAGAAYTAATGLSAIDGVPGELKQAAWTAANLYSGYKGGMFVARRLKSASGFAKTVLKEVADPASGLDAGARMRVAANPDVPDSVRSALERPSAYRSVESTPARLAKNQQLSPVSRAVFSKLSDYRFVQAARLAKDAAAGVPKGMIVNAPFAAGAMASDDPERAGQMLAAGGAFGALGGVAGRFTEARQRRFEEANSDIARMLVDIQGGNDLASGLGGDILRNRVRPGTQFQDGPGGFVLNPEREVSAFLTEVEMAGGDVSAFVRGKSFDELAQWAAYQGFFRDKVDMVPLNAEDFKLNAEAAGQNGAGAYFLQPSEGRRARIFVNADSRRTGLAPHEYGHAVLRGGALSPDQIDAVHADINSRYAPEALRNMAGEYAATMIRAENAKAGINVEPSPAAITAKVNELSQGSMIKGSADGLDWLREEVFAEEFRNANIDLNRARRNIPLGANPVSFLENLLGAQSRALHMAGIDIDPQTGKPMGKDQIFKQNRVAAGDPVVMKNYESYVNQWKRWINDPTHEADPGVPLSRAGNIQETANNPNVSWRNYGSGRLENEFGIKNSDGTVTPKDWNKEIKPTVRARQQAVREMSNRSKEVSSADDSTFGMRRRRDGRAEISGRRLPDSFFFIPQYKPFHEVLRKINAADDAGETMQVRFFAKGKSKDVFKDGIKNTSAVNREALHGNFVAKKDGTLMWGYLDMTQFRNRVMKAIADRNPALSQYDWNLKAIMDDLPAHLTDQRRGKGGAFSVGPERANILNGLIGIGSGPLVGAFGKGTAYKTIHLDSIDAIVPTGKTGGEFDVYRANRNAMPDDPKPQVDMDTDIDPMPQAMPDTAPRGAGRGAAMPDGGPQDAPPFYLKSSQALGAKIQGKAATPDQVKAILTNPQNGIKAEELKWTGVMQEVERLAKENNGKVPKDALLKYLAEDGAVRFEEVTLRESGTKRNLANEEQLSRLGYGVEVSEDGQVITFIDLNDPGDFMSSAEMRQFGLEPDAVRLAETIEQSFYGSKGAARFGSYQLPGGENYREVVLAMPTQAPRFDPSKVKIERRSQSATQGSFRVLYEGRELSPWYGDSGGSAEFGLNTDSEIMAVAKRNFETGDTYNKVAAGSGAYTSSHFPDTPNYVAHMRVNDRTDAAGKPGLFLEEMQSDRHQAGREKGYAGDPGSEQRKYDFAKQFYFEVWRPVQLGEITKPEAQKRWDAIGAEASKEGISKNDIQDTGARYGDFTATPDAAVPDAPFRNSWPLQLFKRALRDAVADGKDWIGWTTGETQAARYDLSKQVDSVAWSESSGDLDAAKSGRVIIREKAVTKEKLSDMIGKEAASRLINSNDFDGDFRYLRGDDLKVGGEGMKSFYDKMVTNEVSKYVKQWGASVEKGEISSSFPAFLTESNGRWQWLDENRNPFGKTFPSRAAAEKYKASGVSKTTPNWRVNITPQMREGIKKAGQALFVGGAAAVVAEEDL